MNENLCLMGDRECARRQGMGVTIATPMPCLDKVFCFAVGFRFLVTKSSAYLLS
jgi:hypothetical protein